jgi:NAD(P)-dependent dehydrogenase (short-subunit alcohol dehydrogenase family)
MRLHVNVVNALSFLVSEDAGFITGQILHVDGGFSRSGASDATASELVAQNTFLKRTTFTQILY